VAGVTGVAVQATCVTGVPAFRMPVRGETEGRGGASPGRTAAERDTRGLPIRDSSDGAASDGYGVLADLGGAQHAVEQQVEVVSHLLGALARPDVQGLGGSLCLLQRGALRQLRAEHEGAEHVAEFLDPELVLERLHASPVNDDAERLQPGGETAPDLLDRTQGTIGGGHGEQPGLGHHGDPVRCGPGGAGEGVEGGGAVDEHEVVVGLDVSEGLLELPDLPDAGVRSVEIDRRRTADHHVDLAGTALRPAAGSDRGTHDLLLRGGEDIRHVEVSGDVDVHAGGDVRLGVEIHDEGPQTLREGRGGQPEGHSCLSDSTLERADAKYMHERPRYLH
jgi:hypothetical protein